MRTRLCGLTAIARADRRSGGRERRRGMKKELVRAYTASWRNSKSWSSSVVHQPQNLCREITARGHRHARPDHRPGSHHAGRGLITGGEVRMW
jgi:hypothetical protein